MARTWMLLAVVCVGLLAGGASAMEPGFCGPGFGACYGYPYSSYVADRAPYFALHPPVYYSIPLPRTYGYSPFPYPPGVMTPEVVFPDGPPGAKAPAPKAQPSAQNRVTVAPLRIINPYVVDPASVTDEGVAIDRRQPQVVYPTALVK